MVGKDKQFMLELLRYLMYKMGDGNTPMRKMAKKLKDSKRPYGSSKNQYDRIMKGRLMFTSARSKPTALADNKPISF